MDSPDVKRKLLVTTSAFPRWHGDQRDMFILELCKKLTSWFDVFVLAPADKESPLSEKYDNLCIYKHFQSPFNRHRIAYGSGIMTNIARNRILYLSVPYYILFQLLNIRKLVKRHKVDIINAHWLIPQGLVAILYKKFFNRKMTVLITVHGTDLFGLENSLGRKIKNYLLKNADGLIVVSTALKNEVRKYGYADKTLVCPMGTDTSLFSPEKEDPSLKKELGIIEEFILFVGGLIETKGIRDLIRALPAVVQRFTMARLVVVGDGALREEMTVLAEDLGVGKNILFTGQLPYDQLPRFFATADLFVLPSHSEGFGLVVAEAMSCGTITIVSDLPSVHDIVTDGVTGFFVPPQNPESLSAKITEVLKNKDLFFAVKEAARQKIIDNFDWEVLSAKYSAYICETCLRP